MLADANLQWGYLYNANLQRALLANANVQGATLYGANLQMARFAHANLQGAGLFGANLQGADLTAATLEAGVIKRTGKPDVDLPAADLTRADLRNANLSDAKLTGVTGLLSEKLAGANLSNAKIPEAIAKFEGLAHVAETSQNARKIFFGMLLGCVYAWLTIATTTDARLLANSASSPLPIIGTEIPSAGFYFAAPAILLCLYLYFHFYLQRLWEGLGRLPAVFTDGRALHESAYPWLLNGLVRAHFERLKAGRSLLSRLENWISILLAWWVVPATLLLFWVRYLPRHEWVGTILQATLVIAASAFGAISYWLARRTLRGRHTRFPWKQPWRDGRSYVCTATVLFAVVLSGISYGAIDGVPGGEAATQATGFRIWVPKVAASIGYRTFADLHDAEVSSRPDGWWRATDTEEQLRAVNGARLKKADLRYALAYGAFLAKADLSRANLEEANLWRTNLQEAILVGANLQRAILGRANLQEALLGAANLQKAGLEYANLHKASLGHANLHKAILVRANLKEANLRDASLLEVDLPHADLQEADLSHANLQRAFLGGVNLKGADLVWADLRTARFWRRGIDEAKLPDAQERACRQLRDAKNWESAYRDETMACGAPIPEPPPEKPDKPELDATQN